MRNSIQMKLSRQLTGILLAIAALLQPLRNPAQSVNLGFPPVINFSHKVYRAGTQIWDIAQGPDGRMWFANNEGLLEFDGAHWRCYAVSNSTIIRAVQLGQNGVVYVGGQGDFGFFSPDANGNMQYHSLRDQLPEVDRQFGDVWDVVVLPEGVFYRTDQQVFRYHHEKVEIFFPRTQSLAFMGIWHNQLVVQNDAHRFFIFSGDAFHPLAHPESFDGGTISGLFPLGKDTMLITTIKNGIFYFSDGRFRPWVTKHDAFLKENRIYCAVMLPDQVLALGTSLNGLVTLDTRRRIIQHLNKKSGLQNNTILSLCALPNGSLWMGLDNGIDFVRLKSAFSTFYPDGDLQGTGYTAEVYQDKIYFGTNTGLYATNWQNYYSPQEKLQFTRVKNSEGQVWSLNLMGDELLMGHHDGAFSIKGRSAQALTHNLPGVWRFVQVSPSLAYAGHYHGLAYFNHTGKNWQFGGNYQGFTESSRLLALDAHQNLWMAHPYRGVYRLQMDSVNKTIHADFFNAKQGLNSNLGNHLFQLGSKIAFTSALGIFKFDESGNHFIPDTAFSALLGSQTQVKYLRNDAEGNIWYITTQEAGLLKIDNDPLGKKVRKIPIPELGDKLSAGFYHILPLDQHNVFFATAQGFIHFDPETYFNSDSSLRLLLHSVVLKGAYDSMLYGGNGAFLNEYVLHYRQNNLEFSFAVPDYPSCDLIQYSHFLEGLEPAWSDWSTDTELHFNQLPPGNYILHLKARKLNGPECEEQAFSFTILPPWYASKLAYFAYCLLLMGILGGLFYHQRRRFEREKQNLQELHQHREAEHLLLAQRSEEAIMQLHNEKLETEVNFKTRELASVTMHLVQKNEILSSIREGLRKLQNKARSEPELDKEIQRLLKVVENDHVLDEDWAHFSQNFDQVYNNFLKRLGEQYTHLSPNDFRLCAYLRMNLSSKEIATLMNISVRGVEASRYRLRKRLNLDTETNLTEFLIRF